MCNTFWFFLRFILFAGTQYSHNITRYVFLLNIKIMQSSLHMNYLIGEISDMRLQTKRV